MSIEVEIPVSELRSVLPGLSKIISKSSTLPVLGCVRVFVGNDQIQLQATNLDDTATVNMAGQGLSCGSVLVPFEELNKVVKGCAATDTIRLSARNNEPIINYPIGSNRVDRKLDFIDPKEWPEEPAVIDQPSVPVTDSIKEALVHALECSSDDSTRYILQGAFLDTRDPKAQYVVACNGHLLFSANSFNFGLKESLIIPNRKFLHWRGFMDDTNCQLSSLAPIKAVPASKGKLAVEARPGWVQFKSDRWTFVTRQIEGEYPNWKQVIPAEWKTKVVLSKEAMQFISTAVPKMPCPDTRNEAIHLMVKEKTLSLSAKEQNNDPWTTLQVSGAVVDGPPVMVAINRNYLAKAMELGLDEFVMLDELSPVVFKKDGRRLVVMTLRPDGDPSATQKPSEEVALAEKVEPPTENVQPAQTKEPAAAPLPATEAPASQSSEQASASTTTTETQTQERTNSMPKEEIQVQPQTKATKAEKPQSAYDQLQDMVEGIRTTLKGVVSDLTDLSKTVTQAYREKRATEKEIESIRESLNEIRKMKI